MNALRHDDLPDVNALDLPAELQGRVLFNEPLARHTSWRVGGPAEVLFKPDSKADLALFLKALPADMPILWLGLGSNLLVRDGGIRGAVIETHGALSDLQRLSDTTVWCDAGVPCAKLAKQCAKWSLGPAEFFAGIPGTLGGALAMNAGAFGGETWRHVVEVETINRHGEIKRRLESDFEVAYRHVKGPHDEWFLGACLNFAESDADGEAEIRALLARRKESQPIGEFSCGSVFTNPPGHHAAKLIESAGLKGFRIGGAVVSTKHANFIINEGEATAAEIEQLIAHVQATVQQQYGVELKPEVRIVGEAAPAKELE
ncbi:MAG: UDP-N-acetylmuramate dehydrogenase [Steroidobacteraceae bacterium]